jgi:protein required for attachment to host cells
VAQLETLILAADGGGARGFAERRRHGPLQELPRWSIEADAIERRGRGRPGGSAAQPGGGRSSIHAASSADAAEARFLKQLAADVEHAAVTGEFERLVLMAPPKALGLLRRELGPQASRRLEASDPHDRRTDTAIEIRARLRDIRIPL